jgi:hypothetical protein
MSGINEILEIIQQNKFNSGPIDLSVQLETF